METYSHSKSWAQTADDADELHEFREEFLFPHRNGEDYLYFCGNSLGLQPKGVKSYVDQELNDWAEYGVLGHTGKKDGWLAYHELVTGPMSRVVGGLESEVVVMNTLTVNLHLMMVSFYRPTTTRRKIVIEKSAFPSDIYAVKSQLSFHGFDAERDLIQLEAREGETSLRTDDILNSIDANKDEVALVMLGGVNYLSGQVFDMAEITNFCHRNQIIVGFDLAHGAGNVPLKLHDWGVDFAVWCTYKYLNSGPGSIAGSFVHEKHLGVELPRFEGWWGTNKATRFKMKDDFEPMSTVESWQLSNPPILPLAALRASLDLFERAGMDRLRSKSLRLTGYLEYLLVNHGVLGKRVSILTPKNPQDRGCQLSLEVADFSSKAQAKLEDHGVVCDFREPNVIRVAPTPFYNSFLDVFRFVEALGRVVD